MVFQNPLWRVPQLGASVAVLAFAAIGCGGGTSITNNNPTATDPSAGCAQNPSAPNCSAPANGNASTILVMVQPVGGMPGSAAASTPTTPPAAPTTPVTRPRPPAGAAGTPGAGFPPTTTTPTTPTTPGTGAPTAAGSAAPVTPGAAGTAAPAGAAGAAAPGMNLAGISEEEMTALRQACVDEINMYRATLTANMLMPMKRASAAQEECSDRGAQMDGDTNQAHGAAKAGLCSKVGLFAENTCPGWPVRGSQKIVDALKMCLQQMWAEGEPPVSRAECQKDYQGCFLKHGHYLNMSDPGNKVASCGFYKMKSGAYWMNQDFAAR